MTARQTEAGRVLTELARSYGWGWVALGRVTGMEESLIRKYANGKAVRPEPKYVAAIARAFGSRDGAKLLYAFGLDALAQQLARQDLDPIDPTDGIDQLPKPLEKEFDERITRLEEAVNRILEEVVGANGAMPGYRTNVLPFRKKWDVRPTHSLSESA